MTVRLKFDGRVFVPDEAVDLPIGYQVDARLPELTPGGNVKGSPGAVRELLAVLAALPPLSDDDLAEWDRVMAEGKRAPSQDGLIALDKEGDVQ